MRHKRIKCGDLPKRQNDALYRARVSALRAEAHAQGGRVAPTKANLTDTKKKAMSAAFVRQSALFLAILDGAQWPCSRNHHFFPL